MSSLLTNVSHDLWNNFTASHVTHLSKSERQDAQLYARIFLVLWMLCVVILFAATSIGAWDGVLMTLPSVAIVSLLFVVSKTRHYRLAPPIAIASVLILNWIDIAFVSLGTGAWLLGLTIYLASFFYQARALALWSLAAICGLMVVLFLKDFAIINATMILTIGFMGVVIINKAMVQRQTALLEQSEARLRAAIDGSLDSFVLLTQIDDTQEFMVADANVVAARMVNRDLPNFIGAQVTDELASIVFPHEEILSSCRQSIQQQRSIHQEKALPSGRWIEYQIVPFNKNIALSMRDVTDKKEAAAKIFQLAVERERFEVLTTFITGASHEFRTPLGIIETSSYLLTKVDDPVRRQNYRHRISLEIRQIVQLVERLALISELQAEQKLEKEPIFLETILKDLQAEFADFLTEKTVRLNTEQATDFPHPLFIHKRYFLTAMREIITNSIRHCPSGGNIHVQAAMNDRQVFIAIEDSAEPIRVDTLPHIFKLFFREDNAHTTPGLGLGLSIARRVIELHGGEISIQPQPEVGNLVKISLPL